MPSNMVLPSLNSASLLPLAQLMSPWRIGDVEGGLQSQLFCLSQIENHAKRGPVAGRFGPECFVRESGPEILRLEHPHRSPLRETYIQSASQRRGKRVVRLGRSRGEHGPVGMAETNQDMGKRDEPGRAVEE